MLKDMALSNATKGRDPMFKLALAYARYAASLLATVGFLGGNN